jgi:uncharacterized protein YndB with AHSA1/START domain
MNLSDSFSIVTQGDREIVMTRVFNAPRRLVFDAWTKPELLKRWLGVRAGWTFAVCEVDLRVGGAYRWVWRNEAKGLEMGVGGVYREIVKPDRIVSTEKFDEAWYAGESLITLVLTERDGQTTATTTLLYESREIRDGVFQSPMKTGVAESYDMLEAALPEMATEQN